MRTDRPITLVVTYTRGVNACSSTITDQSLIIQYFQGCTRATCSKKGEVSQHSLWLKLQPSKTSPLFPRSIKCGLYCIFLTAAQPCYRVQKYKMLSVSLGKRRVSSKQDLLIFQHRTDREMFDSLSRYLSGARLPWIQSVTSAWGVGRFTCSQWFASYSVLPHTLSSDRYMYVGQNKKRTHV